MDGCVVRELKENRDGAGGQNDYEHWVFATTRLALTGANMIKIYQLRLLVVGDPTSPAMETRSLGYRQVHIHQFGSGDLPCDMCPSVIQPV